MSTGTFGTVVTNTLKVDSLSPGFFATVDNNKEIVSVKAVPIGPIADTNSLQTLQNKILESPVIEEPQISGYEPNRVLTTDDNGNVVSEKFYPETDFVGIFDFQTLRNKVLENPSIDNPNISGLNPYKFLTTDETGFVVSIKDAPQGEIIGTDDNQTLTNKTLIGTTNNIEANSLRYNGGSISVDSNLAPSSGQVLTATSSITAIWSTPSTGSTNIFGTGIDGNVTLGSGQTTLTKDMYYNNLTLQNGATLATGGYRIFVKNTLDLQGNSVILNNGSNGVAQTGGLGAPSGTLGGGANGGAGGLLGLVGSNGGITTTNRQMGGVGGQGGISAVLGGNVRSNPSVPTSSMGSIFVFNDLFSAIRGRALDGTLLEGGDGGSGGGSNILITALGGGGGGGAGVVMICAKTITGTGFIQANGGNGGNVVGSGGGGGGGGGCVVVISSSLGISNSNITANGGSGGTGTNNGQSGANGNIFLIST